MNVKAIINSELIIQKKSLYRICEEVEGLQITQLKNYLNGNQDLHSQTVEAILKYLGVAVSYSEDGVYKIS